MGMNATHSTYMPAYGVLCYLQKGYYNSANCAFHCLLFYYRWDMSVDETVHTEDKARTLKKMQELASHSYSSCARHMGCACVLPPLINISLDQIVLE